MINSHRVHAFTNDVLEDSDATAVAKLIRSRQISAEEARLAAIARAQKVDEHICALAEEGFSTPFTVEGEGPFLGVPTVIKDNRNLRGFVTGQGSKSFVGTKAKDHDSFIKQLLSLGLVPIGKSKMPEFGFTASTEYETTEPTRNPWNIDYSAGGSSGGSAALVAAGVVPIAHANDGGGSIRIPASCCGLVGLKPSRGRLVLGDSTRKLPLKIVEDGVLTRSVRDTALFMYGAESYFHNSKYPKLGLVRHPGKRPLRIGVIMHSGYGGDTASEVADVIKQCCICLKDMGHNLVELDKLPGEKGFGEDFARYWRFIAFIVRVATKSLYPSFDHRKLDSFTKGLVAQSFKEIPRTPSSLYRIQKSYKSHAELMGNYDLLLSPVLTTPPKKLGYLSPNVEFDELFRRLRDYACFTPYNNANGSPAISLPFGQSQSGLPVGVHFTAAHGDEKTLLELAYALEEARPWRRIQDNN